jgi:hypothetical protein
MARAKIFRGHPQLDSRIQHASRPHCPTVCSRCSAAGCKNGEVALVGPYRLRDVETGLKVTTDTQFMICSITSRPIASQCATCSAITPGCRAMTGFGCPAIYHPRKC